MRDEAQDHHAHMRGVLLAVAAFTCFVIADTCLKASAPLRLPAYEVAGVAGLLELALLLVWSGARGRARDLRPRSPGRALARGTLDLTNNIGVVIALRHLPLALFYILVFLAPAITALLESAAERHWPNVRRMAAVVLGFAGVVVAVDPLRRAAHAGTAHVNATGLLACMVCACCFAVNMVWSRAIVRDERPEALTCFSSLLQGAVGVLLMTVWQRAPLPASGWALLAGVAVVSTVGGLVFFSALRHTSAATVSQYHYTQLITGALMAYAVWRERPTVAMLAGAVLIVVSGWLAATIRTRPAMNAVAMLPEL